MVVQNLEHPAVLPLAEEQAFTPIPTGSDAVCTIGTLSSGQLYMHSRYFVDERDWVDKDPWIMPDYCWIIDGVNAQGKKERVLFDLGLRQEGTYVKDLYKFHYKNGGCKSEYGLADYLTQNGVELDTIDHMICSHTHFDHIGDLSTFPITTPLILGPDSPDKDTLLDEMDLPGKEKYFTERPVRVLNRTEDTWIDIATFKGLDFWGNGSLYIVDLPGHKDGHIGVLCRTSVSPPVYHLFAADTCHSDIFLDKKTRGNLRISVFEPVPGKKASLFDDIPTSHDTLAKLQRAYEENNIAVWTAHSYALAKALKLTLPDGTIQEGKMVWFKGSLEEMLSIKHDGSEIQNFSHLAR